MKRLIALLLAMTIILDAAPFGAFAAEEETVPTADEEMSAETEAAVMLAGNMPVGARAADDNPFA